MGDSAVAVVFFVVVVLELVLVAAAAAAAAEVFWRFAGGGAAPVEAGRGAKGAGAGTGSANERAGSIAKMPALVLLVGVRGEVSSLPRIVRGGSDGEAAPNDGTKGATAAGGTRKGSTGKPERRDSKLPLPLVLPAPGHVNMYGLNRPDVCC